MKYSTIIFLLMVITVLSCSSQNQYSQKSVNIKKVAAEKLGEDYTSVFNPDKSCVLYLASEGAFPLSTNFFVFSIIEEKILYEEKGDYVSRLKWINFHEIEQRVIPGSLEEGRTERDNVFIINIRSGEKKKQSPNQLLNNQ